MNERKPFPEELLQAILDVTVHQMDRRGHPLTCICGGHAVLLPTVLRIGGTNPRTTIALVCPFCGNIQENIPKFIGSSLSKGIGRKLRNAQWYEELILIHQETKP